VPRERCDLTRFRERGHDGTDQPVRPTRYGMTQPAGGTTKASRLPCQGPKEAPTEYGPIADRPSAMAATLSVPTKLAQPCIARPGRIIGPKQRGGDPTPGQRSPHWKGSGSMRIRAIEPSRAATASNVTIADGHSSANTPPVALWDADTQVIDGLADGKREGDGEGLGDEAGGGVGDGSGVEDGIGAAHPASSAQSRAAANVLMSSRRWACRVGCARPSIVAWAHV